MLFINILFILLCRSTVYIFIYNTEAFIDTWYFLFSPFLYMRRNGDDRNKYGGVLMMIGDDGSGLGTRGGWDKKSREREGLLIKAYGAIVAAEVGADCFSPPHDSNVWLFERVYGGGFGSINE